jgi:hypothetical protein
MEMQCLAPLIGLVSVTRGLGFVCFRNEPESDTLSRWKRHILLSNSYTGRCTSSFDGSNYLPHPTMDCYSLFILWQCT